MKSVWPREDEETLRSLAKSGLSASQIAERMQRPKGSVRARAAKLDIAIAREGNLMKMHKLAIARRQSVGRDR
jgi:hypothetical protein